MSQKYHVSAIAALSDNNVIGKDGKLPWNLPDDMRFFRERTTGKTVLMGRKTYESIGRPLPNRHNIVLTSNKDLRIRVPHNPSTYLTVCHTLDEALKSVSTSELVIIGGSEIYKQTMNIVETLYLTRVHTEVDGDAFFPDVDFSKYKLIWEEKHKSDDKHMYDFTFQKWEKI